MLRAEAVTGALARAARERGPRAAGARGGDACELGGKRVCFAPRGMNRTRTCEEGRVLGDGPAAKTRQRIGLQPCKATPMGTLCAQPSRLTAMKPAPLPRPGRTPAAPHVQRAPESAVHAPRPNARPLMSECRVLSGTVGYYRVLPGTTNGTDVPLPIRRGRSCLSQRAAHAAQLLQAEGAHTHTPPSDPARHGFMCRSDPARHGFMCRLIALLCRARSATAR